MVAFIGSLSSLNPAFVVARGNKFAGEIVAALKPLRE